MSKTRSAAKKSASKSTLKPKLSLSEAMLKLKEMEEHLLKVRTSKTFLDVHMSSALLESIARIVAEKQTKKTTVEQLIVEARFLVEQAQWRRYLSGILSGIM